jgi:hypothetical protein
MEFNWLPHFDWPALSGAGIVLWLMILGYMSGHTPNEKPKKDCEDQKEREEQ